MLIFISGGARSGKSQYAERLAATLTGTRPPLYIASGQALDDEMKARIQHHRDLRDQSGILWETIEVRDELTPLDRPFYKEQAVLWDCLTTWLGNFWFADVDKHALVDALKHQILTWKEAGIPVILVSNEVFDEPVSVYPETEEYRNWLGSLHQWIVKESDASIEVVFGVPKVWKEPANETDAQRIAVSLTVL